MNSGRQRVGKVVPWKLACQVSLDIGARQQAELDVAAHAAGLQGRLQNRKRMFAQQQI